MMKKLAAAAIIGGVAAASSNGQAQAVDVLGEVPKSRGLETLDSGFVKKKKPIQLGALRTREPRLPGGVISSKDRMRMRIEREAARQSGEKKD